MYARSTTVLGDASKVEAGIGYVRDQVMPAMQQLDGFIGLSMLVDRASGRSIVTTAWRDLEPMQTSRETARPLRDWVRDALGGSIEVHEWEIAVLHRAVPTGEGAWARVVWAQADQAQLTHLLELFRTVELPRAEQQPGFCGLSLLRDPRAGTSVTSTTYASRAALDASRDASQALGTELRRQIPFEVTDTAEFEVVMAHLRVPETV
jgi:heme-degrading monooxygenase HmoA